MKHDNIPGYPGNYISRSGKAYRFRNGKWERLKEYISPKGYVHVHLYVGGHKSGRIKRLNRLVAEAYIPNPDNLPVVMHLDNNPLNNKVSNLKWGTYKQNTAQMMNENRNNGQFKSTLTMSQKLDIVRLYKTGNYTHKQLAKMFGLKSQGRISRIINNINQCLDLIKQYPV